MSRGEKAWELRVKGAGLFSYKGVRAEQGGKKKKNKTGKDPTKRTAVPYTRIWVPKIQGPGGAREGPAVCGVSGQRLPGDQK